MNEVFKRFLSWTFLNPLCLAIAVTIVVSSEAGTASILVYILGYIYFLPWIIANSRRHMNQMAIFALNLFLGWTIFGWVASIVWALNKHSA